MSMLVIDGFEPYADLDDMVRAGWGELGGLQPTLVAGRNGGQAVHMVNASQIPVRGLPSSPKTFIVNFAFKLGISVTDIDNFFVWYDGLANTRQGRLQLEGTGGELEFHRGTTLLETTTGLNLQIDQYYYLEMKVTIDNAAGAYEVKLDGVTILSDSGIDTQNSINDTMNAVWWNGDGATDVDIDDLIIMDDQGSKNNDFVGDVIVRSRIPVGDGNQNDFTPVGEANNWETVDDGATPDDDSTYVHSAVVDEIELYDFEDALSDNPEIFAIEVMSHYRKVEAGNRSVRNLVRSGGSNFEEAQLGSGVEYRYIRSMLENNPDGGGAWTKSTFDAAEFVITIES